MSAAVPAQQLYKCKDAAGKITYSSTECARLGLKPGGEIRDQLNVSPAVKFDLAPPSPAKPAAAPAAADTRAAASEDKAPERRCFTVKTAKGVATRCNDAPGQDEAAKQQ